MTKNKLKLAIFLSFLLSSFGLSGDAYANVDNFYFESMHTDYQLSRDADNRSVLKVSETIKPVFPETKQNRGIIRAIPIVYNNHDLSLKLDSVYRNGSVANIYEQNTKKDHLFLVLRDQSNSAYLHGLQEYQINYQMRDVTQKPKDAEINEFYWDVNGVEWNQPFNQVSAKIQLSDDLKEAISPDRLACYTGRQGSKERNCTISYDSESGQISVVTTARLPIGGNLSFAIGFLDETFAPYQKSPEEIRREILTFGLLAVAIVLSVVSMFASHRYRSSKLEKILVTQYLPPEDSDFYIDSDLTNVQKVATSALLNLAVTHKIQIIEEQGSGVFKRKKYKINILKAESLSQKDKNFLRLFFGGQELKNGATKELKQYDTTIATKFNVYISSINERLTRDEIYESSKGLAFADHLQKPGLKSALMALLSAGLIWVVNQIYKSTTEFWISFLMIGAILGIVSFVMSLLPVFTAKGAKIKNHLAGLKRYIKHAETERLNFAQSVEGAERRLVKELEKSGEDKLPSQRVVLYERLLPYAVLFGLEKSWIKQLGALYQNETDYIPAWYVGATAFNVADLSKSLNSFMSSFSSTSSSYSSVSSGSGGGGFSGGGGGGGGGGGC